LTIAIRIAAFALVVIAAALIPAPMRAAGQRSGVDGSQRKMGPAPDSGPSAAGA